jgi:hypothetical protein
MSDVQKIRISDCLRCKKTRDIRLMSWNDSNLPFCSICGENLYWDLHKLFDGEVAVVDEVEI